MVETRFLSNYILAQPYILCRNRVSWRNVYKYKPFLVVSDLKMASHSIKIVKNQQVSRSFPLRLDRVVPAIARRSAAVVLELSLLATSALVPYTIGWYAKEQLQTEPVPLNPMVAATEEAIAKTLAYPISRLNRQVPPLTNLFWCGAIAMPIVVSSWQLYLLGKRGQTTPKRWFGIRVVNSSGAPPGLIRVFLREVMGRWGLPLGTAYLVWRYTGAFPDFGILVGLAGFMLLAESGSALFHSRRRTLHDGLSGTYCLVGRKYLPYSPPDDNLSSSGNNQSVILEVENGWNSSGGASTNGQNYIPKVTTILLTSPTPQSPQKNLWWWMRQNPALTLMILSFAGMVSVLGTFIGTQVYIQSQTNRRDLKQQNNQVFLTLVKQLGSTSATATEERQGAILAIARIDDSRAVYFLVDLLGQENNPSLIDTIGAVLVGKGAEALPPLRYLNQSLANDRQTLLKQGTPEEQELLTLRQRAVNRAIAKIITLDRDRIHQADLSRINLGEVKHGSVVFKPIFDNIDLSGINFRSASLTQISLTNSRFYGRGEDGHFGTFDDWIADLSGADLKEADLTGAILNKVLMNRTSFIRATLNRANLSDSYLIGANLSSAELIAADLSRAILENASLTGAKLGEAKFNLSNLRGANLGEVKAVRSNFTFANLTESNWQGADLSGANLSNAQLRDADLSHTKLVGANLSNAQLQNAKLHKANLSMVDLRGANLAGTDFLGGTFAPPPQLNTNEFIKKQATAIVSGAKLQGVDFTKAKNLDPDQIQYICTHGGVYSECR